MALSSSNVNPESCVSPVDVDPSVDTLKDSLMMVSNSISVMCWYIRGDKIPIPKLQAKVSQLLANSFETVSLWNEIHRFSLLNCWPLPLTIDTKLVTSQAENL